MYYMYQKKVGSKEFVNQLINKGMATIKYLRHNLKALILYYLCISYLEAQAC